INENDQFKLRKNNIVIDDARSPNNAGYTVIRQPDAIAPSISYSAADWTFTSQTCSNLGNHIADPAAPGAIITSQPVNDSACVNGIATFTVGVTPATGAAYQWKMLNNLGIWVNVPNGTPYSGATTAQLTINPTTAALNGTQYRCEIVFASCELISNSAQLNVTVVAVAATTVIQPTCNIPTGTVTITSPTTTGLTYSIDETNFQTGTIFANLAPGSYTITVKNADGCTSVSIPILINAIPNAPAVATTTITQPTCTIPTGTVTITLPTTAGLTYSIDGITFQTQQVFSSLAPGSYTITVKNADGCTSVTAPVVINAVPNAPAVANTTIVQPTCAIPTGTITITSPITAGLTYSIDGTTFQSQPVFANLAPGSYSITVKNADGCTSVTAPVVINAAPNAPAVATTTITEPTCTIPTGTITITSPAIAGITYSIDGITFQTQQVFSSLAPGSYTITVKNADGCTSVTTPIVINAAPNAPVFTGTQGCTPTISGTNYILTGESVTSSFDPSTASYQWIINGAPVGNDETIFNVTSYVASNNIPASAFPLQFLLTVTTSAGCEAIVSFNVESSFCSIPKGISPNNDSLNDSFDLTGLNVRTISIFNRYGKEVYNKANYSNEWGGQSNNGDELPSGIYYYAIELTDGKSETGWVYINREERNN
ncbi:MAG: gliding motility-associated C-terminal domain-containing protein, partial [Sphingobacteriales bacterium]